MEIKVEHLTRVFPGRGRKKRQDVIAVDDISFTVPDGRLVGLLGPSGCGKSTTLNMISGLLAPTSGTIWFGDRNVTDVPPESRGVGMVFQNYALYPHMTIAQNIRFPLENMPRDERPDPAVMEERVLQTAKLVHIEDLLERKPSELSGGQQQRAAIARALVRLPRVLLLDEPLSNLDARLRLQTREEIRRIQQETGITTIFVTHDQDEAMSISDLIVVMKDGKIQQIDSPQNVYDNPANQFVAQFLGIPPINMFHADVADGLLRIDGQPVLQAPGVKDGPVMAGIRPEGFVLDPDGALRDKMIRVEITGRDMSIVSENPACLTPTVRSILSSDEFTRIPEGIAAFDLKPHKVFLFTIPDGDRIRVDLKPLEGHAHTGAGTGRIDALTEDAIETQLREKVSEQISERSSGDLVDVQENVQVDVHVDEAV